jgi:cysteine desulfurase
VEHSAVSKHCEENAKRGCGVTFVRVNEQGELDLEELENAIRPETAMVSVMWANNETGVVFPIARIAEIAHQKGVLFHTDAVQAVGKMPIKLNDLPVNLLSLSAHKLHGPKGVGALYVNRRTRFRPSLLGGGQENGRRSGTENVACIVALGKAAECAIAAMDDEQVRVRSMRDRFESALTEKLPDVWVNGNREMRLPNTTNIAFGGTEADTVLVMLDQRGLCCSAASACRTGSHEPSRVLRAMGISPERARGSLRFSFGRFNSDTDLTRALEIIPQVIGKLRALAPPSPVLA